MKKLKCKSAVRSMTCLDAQTLIIGENDGWIELVHLSNKLDDVEVILSKNFYQISHVFTLQTTESPYQVAVCSYTGVHFVRMKMDTKSS